MANPQIENGHTQIANEILEHLMMMHLSPNQWQVLLCIIRKTYGFHKKVDYIANFQIVKATGLCKAVVSRALQSLESMNIITRNGKHIGFQKDWEKWQKVSRTAKQKKLAEQSTSTPENEKVSSLANNGEVSSLANQSLQFSQPQLAKQSTKVSSPAVAQKKKETIQKKLYKRNYGEFQNVLLSDEEYQKLKERFNVNLSEMIENLSIGIASRGYKYKSHYAAILSWQRKERKNGVPEHLKRVPTKYTEPEDL